jgi:hypothetical protein
MFGCDICEFPACSLSISPVLSGFGASEKGSKTDLLKNADRQHFKGKSAFLRGLATVQSKTTTLKSKTIFDVFDLKAWVHLLSTKLFPLPMGC